MLLIDTSAWIEYLRGTETATTRAMRVLLQTRTPELATTEPVVMEILAGAKDEGSLRRLEALTNGLPLLSVNPHRDYHDAAALYRAARRRGRTVRKLVDCLIATVAIRTDAVLIHQDRDFDAIAAVAPLAARRPGAATVTTTEPEGE